jgi:hypothetical protein
LAQTAASVELPAASAGSITVVAWRPTPTAPILNGGEAGSASALTGGG